MPARPLPSVWHRIIHVEHDRPIRLRPRGPTRGFIRVPRPRARIAQPRVMIHAQRVSPAHRDDFSRPRRARRRARHLPRRRPDPRRHHRRHRRVPRLPHRPSIDLDDALERLHRVSRRAAVDAVPVRAAATRLIDLARPVRPLRQALARAKAIRVPFARARAQ